MKLITVENIVEGMILADDVYNENGIVYLHMGTILKKRHIQLLKKLSITSLYVQESESYINATIETLPNKARKNFNIEFKQTLDSFKKLYNNVLNNAKIDSEIMKEVRESLNSLVEVVLQDNDVLGSLRCIEITDEYTYQHSINVSLLSSMLAKWCGLDKSQISAISVAGLLHDLGKSKIPLEILNKPAKLTDEEFDIIKQHAYYSYTILRDAGQDNADILLGVLQHHENINGSGYPLGIAGKKIHKFAKIIAVADVYDAMTSDRCYHKKMSSFEVADELLRLASFKLDIEIVTVFIKNISRFFVGNQVKLNTGAIGEIVLVNPYHVTRPLVKTSTSFIDLSKNYDLSIIEILN